MNSKIYITITNGKKEEIIADLNKNGIDLDLIDIREVKREKKVPFWIKKQWHFTVGSWQFYFRRLKELIKHRRLEPMLGGGGVGLESFYGYIFDFFTMIVIPGMAFDTFKLIVKKSYKYLKSTKREYLVLVSEMRFPFDTPVKILIPNDLDESELDDVLDQASSLLHNLNEIKVYFKTSRIEVRCVGNYKWKIKFK